MKDWRVFMRQYSWVSVSRGFECGEPLMNLFKDARNMAGVF